MNLRSLLVLLDDDPRCTARSAVAAGYAAAHDSHLIGIVPTGRPEIVSGLGAAEHYGAKAAFAREQAISRADALALHFRRHCHARGLDSVETDICEGDRAAVLLHHAHRADVTVISQAEPAAGPASREAQRIVIELLMHSPRPTLLVPHTGRFDNFGENVLVAWDGSRGCTRAVADALPVLRHARTVRLQVWRREAEPSAGSIRHGLAGLDRWLRWQGVRATIEVETVTGRIADALLETASACFADLIVMGSYGHARWTERILGGTTRTALAESPVPLFLSH